MAACRIARTTSLLLAAILVARPVVAAAPTVTNLIAIQRADSGLVDIYYDLSDADGDSLFVLFQASADRGVTWNLACISLSGDAGACRQASELVGAITTVCTGQGNGEAMTHVQPALAVERIRAHDAKFVHEFLDVWFQEDTQANIRKIAEGLAKKRG